MGKCLGDEEGGSQIDVSVSNPFQPLIIDFMRPTRSDTTMGESLGLELRYENLWKLGPFGRDLSDSPWRDPELRNELRNFTFSTF